ncbi:MAG: MaoC family dehydratase N-terminal domain-containing protein [Pseudomonadota bacterium]|nr:MaoC family dehydratase N-terminal domain-containing protein [Pseudomonadota bacterium]
MATDNLIQTIEAFEEEYKKGVGDVLPYRPTKQASLDNIRRFGDGVGDYNPLWRDPDHAAKSRYQMITAPPPFIYGVSLGVIAGETGAIDRARVSTAYLPVNYAGAEIEFHRPIWLGDRITAQEQVGPTMRKESKRIGAIAFNTGLVTYSNQRQEVVTTVKTLMARYQNTGSTLEYDREPKEAAHVQHEAADPLVYERERRGAEPRYWEDVVEGDDIPSLKKGTYTVTELFLFTHGVLGTGRSPRAALEAEGSGDLGGGGRFDEEHARKRRNMPGQFDFGPQRVCWLSQIVTDWMGDAGTLKKLDASIRHPNVVGDTNTVYGKVSKTYVENDEHRTELQIENRNQSGLVTAFGTATVALPTKD